MDLLEKENFSWIQADKLILFFKLCMKDYINGTCLTRKEFHDSPLDSFFDCFNSVISLSKSSSIHMITREEFHNSTNWMNTETRNEIWSHIMKTQTDLRSVYMKEKLSELHHLTDFDYTVKVCVSSNKSSELNEPLLSLYLHTKLSKEGETKCLHFEMTSEELLNFITLLRDGHQSFDKLNDE